ncbi:MAG: LysR substrate-binding domain-containing protein [Gemmataceae bacterium]|nr:LysR substrate-binding domain-containing protein [Gemmataceae bacterium]MCI0738252.1 LysR substrate-binding domain-containing protein [Gemmataceae bacterium]
MNGEIPHLETFCKAAELLNFTAAAEALSLTQAAVSQRIRALEDDVGVSLFDRQSGRVFLSAQGQILNEFAQRILQLHRQARAALGQSLPEVEGELRLAASTVPAEHLLPALLQSLQKRFPKIHVAATVGDSDAVLLWLETGKVSLALVGRPGAAAWADSKPFARDHLVLVLPPEHQLAKRAKIRLEDLAGESLILREKGSASRACFEAGLDARGRKLDELRVSLELGSNEAIKEAVLRGAGLAFLSAFTVRHDSETGRLVSLTIADLELTRDLYVVTDRRRVLPPPARAFLEVVESGPFARA